MLLKKVTKPVVKAGAGALLATTGVGGAYSALLWAESIANVLESVDAGIKFAEAVSNAEAGANADEAVSGGTAADTGTLVPEAGEADTNSGEEASSTSDDEKKQDVEKDSRRRFNKGERNRAQDRSKDADGDPTCEYCGVKTTNKPGQSNSAQTDHIDAHSKGGRTNDSNAANSCRDCNLSKGAKELGTEWLPPGYR